MPEVKGSVLIVENETLVREAMEDILDASGVKTLSAANGQESISLFLARRHEIGLVILDVRMPGMNGPEVLRELRGVEPTLKALVASGSDERDIWSQFNDEQPTSILTKPFDAATLVAKVKQVLARSA